MPDMLKVINLRQWWSSHESSGEGIYVHGKLEDGGDTEGAVKLVNN